jgi:lipid II:glycine glycyltransferase (peptidoglycan interpeptide bridge formation enzyme)
MDQQTRWSINRTKKYDFEIVEATTDEQFEEFAKCMEHTGERNHFVSHTADYYKQTIKAYGNKARLYLCYLNKEKLQLSQEAIIYDAQLELSNLEQKPHSKKTKKRMNVLHEDIARAQKIIDDTKDLPSKVLLAGSMFITMGGEMTYLYSGAYSQYMKYNAPYALHAHAIQTALKEGVEVYSMYGIQPDWKDGDGHGLYAFKRGFGCSVIELVGEWVIPVHETTYKLYKLAQPDLFPPYEEDEEELDTIDLLTMPAHADKNTEETNV